MGVNVIKNQALSGFIRVIFAKSLKAVTLALTLKGMIRG